MLQTFLTNVIVKAILGWLKSLWDAFVQKQKHIEQGRQEVKDALDKRNAELEAKAKELRDTNPTWDDTSDWLRNRIPDNLGNDLSKNKPTSR